MLHRLFSYIRPYRFYAVLAVLCVAAEATFELLIPLIMADMIDMGVKYGNKDLIFQKGILMLFYALIAMILGMGSAKFSAVCGQGLGAELRKAEYRKLQEFSFSNTDKFRTSSLITRLTGDVTTVQNAVVTGLRPACRGPVMMLTAIGASFYINAQLALIFLVAAPLLAVMLYQIIRRVRPMYEKMQSAVDQVNRIVQENLTAIRVVKAYVREDYEKVKFSEGNETLRAVSDQAFRLSALNMPAMQLVMYTTILCILWFGGKLIHTGGLEVGALTGFLSYILQVLNSLMMISSVFMLLTRALASGKRILEVIDEKVELTDENAKEIFVTHGDVVFDHVWFKYKAEAKEFVLSDISFHIFPGQTVGILGQTGSAKSTLVQLIPRLYDVTEGRVLVDGQPVQEYSMNHLREAVAMVLQKNTLFSGTVLENLRWGKENATQEEIDRACHVACVDEFIGRLEHGYDTELGQGGVNVSGGQKQRLCIARAILKQPKILILDDSTSAVDTATEAKIRQGLAMALPATTKIIIAQRISSVAHADQIVLLEDGKISAVGNHQELLKSNFIYQEIYHSQQEGVGL